MTDASQSQDSQGAHLAVNSELDRQQEEEERRQQEEEEKRRQQQAEAGPSRSGDDTHM